jgi:hypothetical protein
MLALVLAAEGFAARHQRDRFLNIDDWTWRQVGRLASAAAHEPRIVCLGDSLVQVGVATPIIEKRTGYRTYNLALSGGHAAASYFLLERVLASGTKPAALLIDFFPRHLQADPTVTLDPWRSLATTGESLDLAWTARDARFLGWVSTARLLPSLGLRDAIRSNLRGALAGDELADRQFVPPFLRRNLRLNGGGVLCPSKGDAAGRDDLAGWTRRYFDPQWTCHPLSRRYVERTLALAEARGIPVFWLLPPIRGEVQAECERSGFDARHMAFVRSMQAAHRNITVIDGRHSRYRPEVFFDPHHLDRVGAAAFSAEVSETVRRVLGGDPLVARWVDLPAYREAPIDVPLEDLEQSKLALSQARARRPK